MHSEIFQLLCFSFFIGFSSFIFKKHNQLKFTDEQKKYIEKVRVNYAKTIYSILIPGHTYRKSDINPDVKLDTSGEINIIFNVVYNEDYICFHFKSNDIFCIIYNGDMSLYSKFSIENLNNSLEEIAAV